MSDAWWSLPLTVVAYLLARRLAARINLSIVNPLLLAMAIIIPLLPAVVALALPLYEQMHQIRARWKTIISVCFIGSITAMVSGTAIALWMGATPEIAATILPKSVTTPIAMAVSGSLHGIPAISAICVLIAGVLGAVFGHMLLNLFKVRSKSSRGLAIGNASHALGTARAAEIDYQEGAFSSLALVICGIITSLLAPFIFPLLMRLLG